MAKKKKRGKVKRVRSKPQKKIVERQSRENFKLVKTDFALNLIASIIVLVSAILFLTVPIQFTLISFPKAILFAILNAVIGAGMLLATLSLRTRPREASVFMLVFSIIALIFPPHGFVIGPIIGMIGSVVVLAKVRKR
jgi:hypothetical protein